MSNWWAASLSSINYQITDPFGNELGNGQVDVNALGGFDFAFTIPQATNLGSCPNLSNRRRQFERIGWNPVLPSIPDTGISTP